MLTAYAAQARCACLSKKNDMTKFQTCEKYKPREFYVNIEM